MEVFLGSFKRFEQLLADPGRQESSSSSLPTGTPARGKQCSAKCGHLCIYHSEGCGFSA